MGGGGGGVADLKEFIQQQIKARRVQICIKIMLLTSSNSDMKERGGRGVGAGVSGVGVGGRVSEGIPGAESKYPLYVTQKSYAAKCTQRYQVEHTE